MLLRESVCRLGFCSGTLVLLCALSSAQTPLLDVAALLSGESGNLALPSVTKAQAIKVFTPLLKSSPDSSGYVVAAFGLALKGVDVDQNLARMIVPLKLSHAEQLEELVPSGGLAENQIMIADIPNGIYMIYRARKHAPALKLLFTTPVEWPEAETRDDCVMWQLRKDPKPILTMAANDPKIYSTLWDIVDWNVGSMTDRKVFINRMRTARWTSAPMRKVALQLSKDLATPKNRPVAP